MTLKFAFLALMIYSIVMWAFMMGDTLTGYKTNEYWNWHPDCIHYIFLCYMRIWGSNR